jgi:hypothetical protein
LSITASDLHLQGTEKKGFTKSQDAPKLSQGPHLPAAGHRVTILEDPSTDIDTPLEPSSDNPSFSDDTTLIQLEEDTHLQDIDDIVDSTYFEVPVQPTANTGCLTTEHLPLEDIVPGELVHDHQQYLAYNS